CYLFFLFFFNDTATTEIYTLSLHDALPISAARCAGSATTSPRHSITCRAGRSEEHTSELQSRPHLVCRLLLEKKKKGTFGINRRFPIEAWIPRRGPFPLRIGDAVLCFFNVRGATEISPLDLSDALRF